MISPTPLIQWIRGRGAFISAAVLAIFALGMITSQWLLGTRDANAQPVEITIPEGTGATAVAQLLERQGIIRSWPVFSVYSRITGRARLLQAGRYQLCACQSVPELVDAIASGQALSDDIQVTIPEGMNVWEIDRLLAGAGLIKMGEFRTQFSFKEGHLFPETYRFAKNATVEEIVQKMEAMYFERGGTRGDIDLIIASVLEKEAKSADDMALVAGIIHQRLAISMALQIDATVGYGWCLRTRGYARDCDVTQAPIATEIKVDGPYNTYTRTGLPQGAISNPGIQALQAAAHPKDSPYLYYLSTRDGSQIIYSKTLEEHNRNRQKYLGL